MKKTLFIIFSWALIFLMAYLSIRQWMKSGKDSVSKDTFIVTHQMIIEKIVPIGKLELCKFYIKDVMEHEEINEWYFDPKVILIVSGEAVGCIDLTKIDSSSITISDNLITVTLPKAELCYFKINHQDSKIYDIQNAYFIDDKPIIDKAYKQAEIAIQQGALKMGILDQTKKNAELILKPFLEQVSGKKVLIK
jgi:hypothetical protein